eukprot:3086629-Alexandrium_andersonii.AAC.1
MASSRGGCTTTKSPGVRGGPSSAIAARGRARPAAPASSMPAVRAAGCRAAARPGGRAEGLEARRPARQPRSRTHSDRQG